MKLYNLRGLPLRNGKRTLLILIILSIPVLFSSLKYLSRKSSTRIENMEKMPGSTKRNRLYLFPTLLIATCQWTQHAEECARHSIYLELFKSLHQLLDISWSVDLERMASVMTAQRFPSFELHCGASSDKACTFPQLAIHLYNRLLRRLKFVILNSSSQATATVLRRLSGLIAHFHLIYHHFAPWCRHGPSSIVLICYTMPHVQMLAIRVSAPYPPQCVQRLSSLQGLFSSR